VTTESRHGRRAQTGRRPGLGPGGTGKAVAEHLLFQPDWVVPNVRDEGGRGGTVVRLLNGNLTGAPPCYPVSDHPGMVNGLFEDKSINRAEEDAPCLRYYG